MFCFHKYGDLIIDKKNKITYQQCSKCNKVLIHPCSHKWKIIDQTERFVLFESRGFIYTLQCTVCGTTTTQDNSWYTNYEKITI